MSDGAALIWAAGVTELGALLAVWLTWKLTKRSSRSSAVDAVAQARADFEKLNTQRETERERERTEDKDEILRSRTEVERLRMEVDARNQRIEQLLGGGPHVR